MHRQSNTLISLLPLADFCTTPSHPAAGPTACSPLETLPTEILSHICGYVDSPLQLSATCRTIRGVCTYTCDSVLAGTNAKLCQYTSTTLSRRIAWCRFYITAANSPAAELGVILAMLPSEARAESDIYGRPEAACNGFVRAINNTDFENSVKLCELACKAYSRRLEKRVVMPDLEFGPYVPDAPTPRSIGRALLALYSRRAAIKQNNNVRCGHHPAEKSLRVANMPIRSYVFFSRIAAICGINDIALFAIYESAAGIRSTARKACAWIVHDMRSADSRATNLFGQRPAREQLADRYVIPIYLTTESFRRTSEQLNSKAELLLEQVEWDFWVVELGPPEALREVLERPIIRMLCLIPEYCACEVVNSIRAATLKLAHANARAVAAASGLEELTGDFIRPGYTVYRNVSGALEQASPITHYWTNTEHPPLFQLFINTDDETDAGLP